MKDRLSAYPKVPYEDRLVGLAYTTWHRRETRWGPPYTWDIPLLGKYCSDDRTVIAQHGRWLADAGVDFIFIDWSNNVNYDMETMRGSRPDFDMIEHSVPVIFEEWKKIENAPKIVIFAGCPDEGEARFDGRLQKKVDQIYRDFIQNPEYNEMYLYYEGKPLLLLYAGTPSFIGDNDPKWNDDRFTVRWITGYVTEQPNLHDENKISYLHWSWEERGAQTYTVHNGYPEAITVVASWRSQGKDGSDPYYIPAGKRNNGETFRRQWQRAHDIGVKFALVVSFNEWTTGEQLSLEVSKDIEPSERLGTFYLDLLKKEIRRFKGREL